MGKKSFWKQMTCVSRGMGGPGPRGTACSPRAGKRAGPVARGWESTSQGRCALHRRSRKASLGPDGPRALPRSRPPVGKRAECNALEFSRNKPPASPRHTHSLISRRFIGLLLGARSRSPGRIPAGPTWGRRAPSSSRDGVRGEAHPSWGSALQEGPGRGTGRRGGQGRPKLPLGVGRAEHRQRGRGGGGEPPREGSRSGGWVGELVGIPEARGRGGKGSVAKQA